MPRASSCRDNLQQSVAPRRQGPWVPSPSYTGVLVLPLLCALNATHDDLRVPLLGDEWQSGRRLFGLPAREF